ncbi:MAG: holin family protein [Bacteroidales bacterium]|nr:holin family protein [Bacteroidales bacterium]
MPFLKKIADFFTGSGENIINSISDSVDKFVTTKEEREKLKQELIRIQNEQEQSRRNFMLDMEKLTQEREAEIEETIRAELNAKKEVLLAELEQGDNYTKRARPTVVYVGLIFILLEVLGVRHIILHELDIPAHVIENSDAIFKMFLGVWGGILGIYSIGRSAEKRGTRKSWTSSITGNKAQPDNVSGAVERDIRDKIKEKISWR